jgi:hypothetical protein
MKHHAQKNSGLALVEVVIASAIMLLVVLETDSAYNTYVQYALTNQSTVQAEYLTEEGLEAVTLLRDSVWTTNIASLTPGTTYYLYFSGTAWSATTTPQYVDGQFLRSFTVANVNRDANFNIAASGTLDPNTKQITATVAYRAGHATTTQSISTYITNLNGN